MEFKTLLSKFYEQNKTDSFLVFCSDTLYSFPFYKAISHHLQSNFISKGAFNKLGDSLIHLIKNARLYGLYPEDYWNTKIDSLSKILYNAVDSTYNVTALVASEIYLNDALLKFAAHLNRGRFNYDTLLLEWNTKRLDSNWINIVKYGLEKNNIKKAFDSLEPIDKNYKDLKKALNKFVVANKNINWDSISFYPEKTKTELFNQLKERFITQGFYNDSLKINDSLKLSKAIKKFQKTFNLDPDGKLGKYTRQALGLNKENTIRQIEMALERLRWREKEMPKKYAEINIPSANMNVWEWDKKHKKDTLVMRSKVVVGKPDTPTPLLQSKINYIDIYPYWNVPFKIATEEILPIMKYDTSYLRKKNFEVISGRNTLVENIGKLPWKKYTKSYFPIRIRQRIGSDNSLGICKFNFNNKYGVYLHDTNSKRYFKTYYRFQSHGCIRLEEFITLAKFLIRDDTLKTPYDTLSAYFSRQVQTKINLRKPLPIYVNYYTAQTDSIGNLKLFLDIYNLDATMKKMVYTKN
ncbi:MAG: L,D-transpeptidase family protein [Bacteroidetes bacterium]|nr:L,D-transpeptidase family protein [Bacteroidota bacterium]